VRRVGLDGPARLCQGLGVELGPLPPAARRARFDALVRELSCRARPVRIVKKGALWHQRLIARLLRVVTLGGQDRYLSRYVTTLGHTILVPDDWDDWEPGSAYEVLRHEAVHVAQFERYGWLGMIVLYGLVPFPLGLAYFRARLELEAYRVTIEATAEVDGLEAATSAELREHVLLRFTGPDYAWMWPFPETVRGWLRAAQDDVARRASAG
jgi:hypothetical protein